MKNIIHFVIFFILLCASYSCGSMVNGLVSLYGNDNYNPYVTPGVGGYNPNSNFWNSGAYNSVSASVPIALDPNTAADAAAKQVMNNVNNSASGFWENAAKNEQQRQKALEAYAKDYWEHPENYQNVPVQSGGSVGTSTGGGTVSVGSSSSGSRSSSSSSRQHDLCNGTGKCNSCNGTGTIWRSYGQTGKTQCPNCHGSGKCSGCNGTGRR